MEYFRNVGKHLANVSASHPKIYYFVRQENVCDRLCGLVVRVLGYRSGGPGSIPGTTKKKKE
jgi:hypothetical protein